MEHTETSELKSTVRNYTIALEKRLNEIRRLESVNTAMLEALEDIDEAGPCPLCREQEERNIDQHKAISYNSPHASPLECITVIARAAIKAAKGDA